MDIIHSRASMLSIAQDLHRQGQTLALVPTMGNLHAGHLSLVDQIKPLANQTIVSIFVNPTQFGPTEDFVNYPRTLERDCEQLKARGVNFVFAPDPSEMYSGELNSQTLIKVPVLSDILCGQFRPGHFQGVATIVCKLFQVVQPDLAIFGQKDYQQLLVIRRMVADLCLSTKILSAPIVREANGLAMSSRNQYLNAQEREQAAILYSALCDLVEKAQAVDDYDFILQESLGHLNAAGFRTDYLALRRQDNLSQPLAGDKKLVALVASFLGKTRLIDNILFEKS